MARRVAPRGWLKLERSGERTGLNMPVWEIDGKLARSGRPGYFWEDDVPVSKSAVDEWLSEVRSFGIRSIICLLGHDQLSLYADSPHGLLKQYEEAGFQVAHVPAEDHVRPPLSQAQLAEVWSAYERLPKPVLVHCSAGISRSGAAVEHVMSRVLQRRRDEK
jgi:protein tyrosine phosphatase (PTP) superfamily phosphohydrolase (DUF442 family)